MDDGSAAWIGTILQDKWRIDAKIAVGGVAMVFHATHRDGHVAAVKVMHPQFARNADVRRRFLREGYAANKVGHPGVVRILEDDTAEDGSPYIVMELLQDGELLEDRRMRYGGNLPVIAVLTIADQVLDVLAAAHERGIVHRDIKPENIFVMNNGTVKVLDFGIAHIREAALQSEPTATGLLLGTPEFMSPEQALGKRGSIDAQTDIYALGATMFTLLTGMAVHTEDAVTMLLVAAATRQARSLASVAPHISQEVAAVVDKALMLEKGRRWPNARTMQEALRKLLPSDPPTQTTDAVTRGAPSVAMPPTLAAAGMTPRALKGPPLKAPPPKESPAPKVPPKPLPMPGKPFANMPSRPSRAPLALPSRRSHMPSPPAATPPAPKVQTRPASPFSMPRRIDTPTAFAPPPIPSDIPPAEPTYDDLTSMPETREAPEPTTLSPPARPLSDYPTSTFNAPNFAGHQAQHSTDDDETDGYAEPPAPPPLMRPAAGRPIDRQTPTGAMSAASPFSDLRAAFGDPDEEEGHTLAGWSPFDDDEPEEKTRAVLEDTTASKNEPPVELATIVSGRAAKRPPLPPPSRDDEATQAVSREQIEAARRGDKAAFLSTKQSEPDELGALVAAVRKPNRVGSGQIAPPVMSRIPETSPMYPEPPPPVTQPVFGEEPPNVFGNRGPAPVERGNPFADAPQGNPFADAPQAAMNPFLPPPTMPMGAGAPPPPLAMQPMTLPMQHQQQPQQPPPFMPPQLAQPLQPNTARGGPTIARKAAMPTFVIKQSRVAAALEPVLKPFRALTKGIPQSTLVLAAVAATFLFLTLLLGSCLLFR